jgi:hypothetical protein
MSVVVKVVIIFFIYYTYIILYTNIMHIFHSHSRCSVSRARWYSSIGWFKSVLWYRAVYWAVSRAARKFYYIYCNCKREQCLPACLCTTYIKPYIYHTIHLIISIIITSHIICIVFFFCMLLLCWCIKT